MARSPKVNAGQREPSSRGVGVTARPGSGIHTPASRRIGDAEALEQIGEMIAKAEKLSALPDGSASSTTSPSGSIPDFEANSVSSMPSTEVSLHNGNLSDASKPNLHDAHDAALGASGADSIFQRARLLTADQRKLLDAIYVQLEAGEALDIRKAVKAAQVPPTAVRGLEEKLTDIYRRCGLTDEYLASRLFQLTKAKTTKFFQKDGKVRQKIDVDDNATQLAATQFALRTYGAIPRASEDDSEDSKKVVINVQVNNIGRCAEDVG